MCTAPFLIPAEMLHTALFCLCVHNHLDPIIIVMMAFVFSPFLLDKHHIV